jgi:DNA-binding NtrC family response regulator
MSTETEGERRSSLPRVWHPRQPHLFVVLEGDNPTAGGLRCSLHDVDEVFVGRTETRVCERAGRRLTIGLPDRKLSARHGRLVRTPDAWDVTDASSTNGTYVNGRLVTTHTLRDGDWIEVGRACLRIRFAVPTPGEAPSIATGEEMLGFETLLPALFHEHREIARIAASRVPVLLLGETGTGKEVAARSIHAASGRAGEFVAINSAAMTESLVEAQLFGHVKGAFSGATGDAMGFVRAAHEGTLFLDEIGDLRPTAQGVLLRVLQEGEVVPVGATRPIAADLRVIAATHRPIEDMIDRGEFRGDLYARLQGFTHRLWPLRDRREDIGVLVAATLRRLANSNAPPARLTADAAHVLVSHAWPFNVRELVQVLSRAITLATDGTIQAEHLAPILPPAGEPPSKQSPVAPLTPRELGLRASLLSNLERFDGNVAAVAREMNKGTMQVYRWMRKLGIDPKAFR